MKALIIILLLVGISFSQTDSLSLSFYPLQKGNYWEYKQILYMWDKPPLAVYDTSHYSIEITGDTIIQNFESYKILKKTKLDSSSFSHEGVFFERVDSNTCNVYRYSDYAPNQEYLIDSLKSLLNDSSKSSHDIMFGYREFVITVCTDISENFDFDVRKYAKHFEADVLYPFEYTLLEDIGLILYHDTFDFGWMTLELQYAKINGIHYGDQVNYIENNSVVNDFDFDSVILYNNYPNPFNNESIIKFYLDSPSNVEVDLYSLTGEEVLNIFNGYKPKGMHYLILNGENLSSGVYIYTVKSSEFFYSNKCILLK